MYNPDISELSFDDKCTYVRNRRNKFLMVFVDSMNAVKWSSLTPEQQQIWSDYRQALLDIPQQTGFPDDVVWPTPPS